MFNRLYKQLHLDRYVKSWLIFTFDVCVSTVITVCALLFTGYFLSTPAVTLTTIISLALFSMVSGWVTFYLFKTYKSVIRHSTLRSIGMLGFAVIVKCVVMYTLLGIFTVMLSRHQVILCAISDGMGTIFALVASRVLMLIAYDTITLHRIKSQNRVPMLIFGVDDKQVSMLTRLNNSPHYDIVGFLTHGKQLKEYNIAGKRVYYFENQQSIEYLSSQVMIGGILFGNYETLQAESDRLVKYCTAAGVKILIAPPIDEVRDGHMPRQSIREVKIEDLLGRPEIEISLDNITSNFRNKTILVTGAAGSIGSELCRQLTQFGIRKLILFDNAETPMHNLRLELEDKYPDLQFRPIVGDIRSPRRLEYLFCEFHPQIVFHAAAYKHVPLMEENPCEAVLVNVVGTRNIADMCIRNNVEKMIMISTDKAVNPTNIMGCSKRLAEIYVQSLGQAIASGKLKGSTKFITTRFGNVLGSNGSVIPRFRQQIECGGPITVTHPDIVRFFMTIPEACRLVMEAATISSGNEICVFDMGCEVKIADLARRMIELAGLKVDQDIKIEYTGLRPGEKLYEEVLSNAENTRPTSHDKIRIAKVREYSYAEANHSIMQLEDLARIVDVQALVTMMKHLVPEFKSRNSKFEEIDQEIEVEESRHNNIA